MSIEQFFACLAAFATIAGATWVLRTELSDIKIAIRGHIAEDQAVQKSHETRIVKLEEEKKRRGRR